MQKDHDDYKDYDCKAWYEARSEYDVHQQTGSAHQELNTATHQTFGIKTDALGMKYPS